jgi:hypothetical protein
VPIAMTQEQQALQASLRDWAKRTNPIALVRAQEPHEIPPSLAQLGVFAIPSDGGTITDLAAALENPRPVVVDLAAQVLAGADTWKELAQAGPGQCPDSSTSCDPHSSSLAPRARCSP